MAMGMERHESVDATVDTMNELLRGELAAVESYQRALAALESHEAEEELRDCLISHQRRVAALRRRIGELGGAPATTSGAWGAFARLFEAGAAALGDDAAIAALEEGEDRGLKQYLDAVGKLDRDTRRLVAKEILPEQVRTHDSLSDLKLSRQGT
jgi:demethoxyubiquinone hydroxylase (CLK1/Coq7/Cat5 family)